MVNGDIIRAEDSRRVKLGQVIKAGLIGIVHEGVAQDTGEKVAIKTPAPNLSQDAYSRFQQEYFVLKALVEKMGDRRYVPWVLKVENETGGIKALVMEYIGEDRLLTDHLPPPETPGLKREKMALRAAVQYARLLEILHECNYTCQDRKLADLRWLDDGGNGRLVVLDWNVVDEGEAQRADDIYLFGVLWYQLLAGRYPTTLLNPLDDSLWRNGAISYGTRRLLLKVLSSNSAGRFTSAQLLRHELQERRQVLEKSGTQLREEGQILHAKLDPFLRGNHDNPPDFNQEWQALDLLDLADRQGEPVELERGDLLRLVGEQGDRLVNQVKQPFIIRQYEVGQKLAQQALDIAKTTNDHRLRLNVARWQLLIEAALDGLNENIFLNKLGLAEPLAQFVERLQDISAAPATTDLRRLRSELARILPGQIPANTETGLLLQELDREIEAWQLWLEASELEESEAYAEAQQKVEQLEGRLNDMVIYGQALRSIFAQNLTIWRKDLAAKARVRHRLNYWGATLSNISGKPYYLEYLQAIELRARLDGSSALMPPDFKAVLTALPNVSELYRLRDYAVVDPSLWPAVIRTANKLIHQPDLPDELKAAAGKYLQEAEKIADNYFNLRSARTDEWALNIFKALQEPSITGGAI